MYSNHTKSRNAVLLIAAILLIGCNRKAFTHVSDARLNQFDTSWTETNSKIDKMIRPFREQIKQEMNEVVGYSSKEMVKARPESALGNVLADMLLNFGIKEIDPEIDLCVMNYGGFRVPIPEGQITRGKVFELMPFENTLTLVTITQKQLAELADHIYQKGGEPFSSSSIVHLITLDSTSLFTFYDDEMNSKEEYRILTSNYLADGGDGFSVFLNGTKREDSRWLIRSAIIKSLQENTSIEKPLNGTIDGRIILDANE